MPKWAIVAALLAALGYIAVSSSKKEAESKISPKEAFEKGKLDGKNAAIEDKKNNKPSRVIVTQEDVLKAIQDPSSWMNDESKAYSLGFNSGYLEEFIPKLVGTKDIKYKKEDQKDIVSDKLPDQKPENWPNSCKWPPSSLDEMDAILERLHDWESSSEGPMGTVKRKPTWLPDEYWPPICPPDGWPDGEKWPPKNKATFDSWKAGTLSKPSGIRRAFSDLSTGITRTIAELKFGKCEGALGDLGDYKLKYISDLPPDFKNIVISDQVRGMIKGDYPATAFDYWSDLLDKEAFSAALNGDKTSSVNLSRVIRCLKRERINRYGEKNLADVLPDEQKYPGVRSLPNNDFKRLAVKVVSNFYYPSIFEGVVAPHYSGDYATVDELRYFASVCREIGNEDAAIEFDTLAEDLIRMGQDKKAPGSGITKEDAIAAAELAKKAYDAYSSMSGDSGSGGEREEKKFEASGKVDASITLGTRMSPEWVGRVPEWYFHPSFRKMNQG